MDTLKISPDKKTVEITPSAIQPITRKIPTKG